MKRLLAPCVLFFQISLSLLAQADLLQQYSSYSIEELLKVKVGCTSFFEQQPIETPGNVYIVPMKAEEHASLRSYEDIVNYLVPGNIVWRHSFTGALLGTRGVITDNNSKSMLLLDGQDINMRTFNGTPNGLENTLTGDLERMEIINGPGSLVHGSGAINGIVNFVPKNGTTTRGFLSMLPTVIRNTYRKQS
ncbi:MAG: TonB-dependent receptor plug domain-containing protein [Bacteroidales bacterium]|nr:TonB-dependent receptor plug domain-containing protein [Bacteroidales bacterium]